jgi:biotin synthase
MVGDAAIARRAEDGIGAGTGVGTGASAGAAALRISAGTAAALGFSSARPDDAATTAYIMVSEGCAFACQFCPQARGATSDPGMLSRVLWPECALEPLVAGIAAAHQDGRLRRACVQVVHGRGAWPAAEAVVGAIVRRCRIPVSVSTVPAGTRRVTQPFAWGAERVGLPLDAATAALHLAVKGRPLGPAAACLERAARQFLGRVSTHLIVGLGETEEEAVRFVQRWHDAGVTVALFAFTPVRGTPLADRRPPALDSYRRVQAAAHLVRSGLARAEAMRFSARPAGRLMGFGIEAARARAALADGAGFQTPGCLGCNRPYYNERPGDIPYNYPRPLTAAEAAQEVARALEA